jgi:hypothetical protein
MDDDASAWWGKRALVKIKISVEAGIGGKFGLAARGAKEIECDVGLWHQEVPFHDGKPKWFFPVWIARSAELR